MGGARRGVICFRPAPFLLYTRPPSLARFLCLRRLWAKFPLSLPLPRARARHERGGGGRGESESARARHQRPPPFSDPSQPAARTHLKRAGVLAVELVEAAAALPKGKPVGGSAEGGNLFAYLLAAVRLAERAGQGAGRPGAGCLWASKRAEPGGGGRVRVRVPVLHERKAGRQAGRGALLTEGGGAGGAGRVPGGAASPAKGRSPRPVPPHRVPGGGVGLGLGPVACLLRLCSGKCTARVRKRAM